MPETTAENKTIGGFAIPANTTVIIDNQRLNGGSVTWGPDGDQFRPDRFLEVSPQAQRCGFMRFGTGAASGRCLGKNAADVVFKLTTIAVVEKFRMETLIDDGEDKTPSKRGVPDVRFIEC
jgi:cytochrome P450